MQAADIVALILFLTIPGCTIAAICGLRSRTRQQIAAALDYDNEE